MGTTALALYKDKLGLRFKDQHGLNPWSCWCSDPKVLVLREAWAPTETSKKELVGAPCLGWVIRTAVEPSGGLSSESYRPMRPDSCPSFRHLRADTLLIQRSVCPIPLAPGSFISLITHFDLNEQTKALGSSEGEQGIPSALVSRDVDYWLWCETSQILTPDNKTMTLKLEKPTSD